MTRRARRTALTVVLLPLAAILLVPPASPAVAQTEMCQGQPATIVATTSEGATGTDGDDVIVARVGSERFRAWGKDGDDLICVSGNPPKGVDVAVDGSAGHDSLELEFGEAPNTLYLFDVEDLDVSLGGGFDRLSVFGARGTGRIDGGPDGGAALVGARKKLTLDMSTESLVVRDDRPGTGRFTFRGFQRVKASARRLSLTGDAGDNGFEITGCRGTVRGGGGDDVLVMASRGCDTKFRLLGGQGDDRLRGYKYGDVLIGGPGNDRVDGGPGDDRCVAEKEKDCER
jgi:Ca2+-binding RTX toxin-like protein